MLFLLIGLVLFLGAHSIRIFADGLRTAFIARRGEGAWKGLTAIVSLAGFVLLIIGYCQARYAPPLYSLPPGFRHITFALVPIAFVLLVAAYWPANHVKTLVRDPMVAGVGLWALAHLLVKASPAAVVLFGAFLVWAATEYFSLRRREAGSTAKIPPPRALNTALVVIVGVVLAGVFAMALHKILMGVSPMG